MPRQAALKEWPRPVGYHLLIRLHKLPEKQGSVYLPEKHKAEHDLASIVGYVEDMGPDAYSDREKFPNGPWCKIGQWVLFRSYSGTRFKLTADGQEYRLINDDTVEAVINDPADVERI